MRPPPLAFVVSLSIVFLLVFSRSGADAAEPFFKKGDVIALVGGEDMVVASEDGYLELLLTRALPDYHLRFRNLAWEGDTVFEQHRELNFPTWEEQLDKIGATVVIAQFGQMESLAGEGKAADFAAAYKHLLERFGGDGKRRIVVLSPFPIGADLPGDYSRSITRLAQELTLSHIDVPMASADGSPFWTFRDRVHLDEASQLKFAKLLSVRLAPEAAKKVIEQDMEARAQARSWLTAANSLRARSASAPELESQATVQHLYGLIAAKNRLWFDYWRPQNWAFLAGDRTAQPSSRDHLDPSKRWFPPEREQFLPLVEAKEKEIDALAAQLAQP